MQSASYCVYNQTRNTLLAEHVAFLSDPHSHEQLLALVLNGPGRNSHSAVLLTNASAPPEIPRLFAFDIAYLDGEQCILQAAAVGPATAFPSFNQGAKSILFLPDQSLHRSRTLSGDAIKICTEAELAVLLRAASEAVPETPRLTPVHSSQLNDDFDPNPHQLANEPFSASLVHLPVSGFPTASEFFLHFKPARAQSPEPSTEPPSEVAEANEEVPASDVLAKSEPFPPLGLHDLPPQESRPSITPTPDRFFAAAFEPTRPPQQIEPTGEREQPLAPEFSSLPPSLKAIIHFVDEQLRREKHEPQPASEHPETTEIPPSSDAIDIFEVSQNATPIELDTPWQIEEPATLVEPATLIDEPVEPVDPRLKWEEVQPAATAHAESLSGTPPPHLRATQITASGPIEEISNPPSPALHSEVQSFEPSPKSPAIEPAHPPLAPVNPPAPAISAELQRAVTAQAREKLSFATRVQRWLAGESISITGNRRRGERVSLPGLVAFYFTGGAPKPHDIVNISSSGLYLRSKELWSPNTLVRMTLERPIPEQDARQSITVLARVVRVDDGGIGHEFVTTETLQKLHARELLHEKGTDRKQLERFLALPRGK